MTNIELTTQESTKKQEERERTIQKIYTKSEDLIPEEKREDFLATVRNNISANYPVGFHANVALNIIAYLNNEEISLETAYQKLAEYGLKSELDELTVAEIVRDYSARGDEFFTVAYQALRPRLLALATKVYPLMGQEIPMIPGEGSKFGF